MPRKYLAIKLLDHKCQQTQGTNLSNGIFILKVERRYYKEKNIFSSDESRKNSVSFFPVFFFSKKKTLFFFFVHSIHFLGMTKIIVKK